MVSVAVRESCTNFRLRLTNLFGPEKYFHHHARGETLPLNYQLSAAVQSIGCGPADASTLSGFIDLPGKSIEYHLKNAEKVLGKIQIEKRKLSEDDAVRNEVKAHKEHEKEGLKYHECTMEGHEHPPLPMIKGSYGA